MTPRDLLAPNRPLHAQSFAILTAAWIALMLILWSSAGARYLPTPLDVLKSFPGLWNEDGLGVQIWTSFELNLEAAFCTFIASLLIAYATVLPVFRPLAMLISSGRYNGMIGLPLVFLSLLHDPHWVKIALLMFGTGVFAVLSLVRMIEAIPQELFDHSRTLRMSEWRVFYEVVILGQFDQVLDIFRGTLAMLWMLLPMVEGYFRFEGGVGTLMLTEAKHLNLDSVFCIMFVVLAIGFAQDLVLGELRVMICPYAELGVERK
jgi:NitT/TauT family transport system permease protein